MKLKVNPSNVMSLLSAANDPDNPAKPSPQVYKNPAQIAAQIQFDENFNKRHNLMQGVGLSTNKKVGDPVVQFRTEDGKPYVPKQMPASMINKSVPDWVNKLEWDQDWQMPYYKDGNDMKYVPKEFYNLPRFRQTTPSNPQQAMALAMLAKK